MMRTPQNRPITCLIINDDDRSNHTLSGELRMRSKEFNLLSVHTCFKEGIARIQTLSPQVVFVDISTPFFTGREFLGVMSARTFKIIFLATESTYVHHSIKSTRFDCILKPISRADLKRTLNRLLEDQGTYSNNWFSQSYHTHEFTFAKMALPTSNGHVFVDPNDILYCEASSEYTNIKTLNSTYLICKHLKYFEARLDSRRFFRVHKSFLLNLDHIRSVIRTEGGHVIMSDNKVVPVGRSRKKEFSILMGI